MAEIVGFAILTVMTRWSPTVRSLCCFFFCIWTDVALSAKLDTLSNTILDYFKTPNIIYCVITLIFL